MFFLRLPPTTIAAFTLALCGLAQAQNVVLTGVLGSKALLVVEGSAPKAVAAGESHQGIKVVSVAPDRAVVDAQGARHTLVLGETPSRTGVANPVAQGRRIVLTADGGGHFIGQGSVNGKVMQFLVDTGATSVAIGAAEADRMGLDYRSGQPIALRTANGNAQGWRIKLPSVRVGDVELRDVDAVITPQAMPYVLLGNSFLTQFQMTRLNDQMVLEKRL